MMNRNKNHYTMGLYLTIHQKQ